MCRCANSKTIHDSNKLIFFQTQRGVKLAACTMTEIEGLLAELYARDIELDQQLRGVKQKYFSFSATHIYSMFTKRHCTHGVFFSCALFFCAIQETNQGCLGVHSLTILF
jgi:hypothetical protein